MSSGSAPIGPGDQNPFGVPPYAHSQPAAKSNTIVILIAVAVLGMVMLMCGGVLIALLLPAVQAASQAAQRMQRSNNVKQIGLALHNYHAAYNQLPFTEVTNHSGQTMLGWRLAISPFVEGQAQWETLAKDEPWNSDTNQPLIQNPPLAFRTQDAGPGETHLFAIVAPNGMFHPAPLTKIAFRDVLDGLASTLMIIELPNRSVEWTSTKNLTPDEAFEAIQALQPPDVAHVLMGDGSVRAITADLDRETFDAMITRDGNETVNMGF